jgi:hypothetical protein
MHPYHIPELQLSTTHLTHAAETGQVGRDLGFFPSRMTTPPRRGSGIQGISRFFDASSGRPAPRNPRPAA